MCVSVCVSVLLFCILEKKKYSTETMHQIVFVDEVSVYVQKSARYSTRGLMSAFGQHRVGASCLNSGHVWIWSPREASNLHVLALRMCARVCEDVCVCACVWQRGVGGVEREKVRERERQRESGMWLVAGKELLEWGKEVPYDRNTPGPTKQPLPGQTTHVRHVGVVDRETKDPEKTHGNKWFVILAQDLKTCLTASREEHTDLCVHL